MTRYNLLNLPEEYVGAQGDTVRYVYSAEGEKLFVQEKPHAGAAQGTEYAANYRIENGAVTMIHTDAGYYTPVTSQGGPGVSYSHVWYLKDHLGNNRVLAYGSGSALKTHHYDPYGMEINVASTPVFPSTFPSGSTESPYKYGGKEWNETTSTYDFEARYLSPAFHRFTTMDPLAEKYYSISPYAYCAGNPVNMVDPSGRYLIVIRDHDDETRYIVCGGKVNDDYNIYECYKNDEGTYSFRSIGLLCMPTSFYDSETGKWAAGSILDPNDNSGKDFLTRMKDCDLFDYMDKARSGHEYDFKWTNGTKGVKYTLGETNRGMPVYESGTGQLIYASARDIGNIAAGLVAGNNGLSWVFTRLGCDMYQSYTTSRKNKKLIWETEGMTTQNAQKEGWLRSLKGARYQISGKLFTHHGLWQGF